MTERQAVSDESEPWEDERSRYAEPDGGSFEFREGPDGRPQFPFDLEERTAKFGEAVIQFCKKFPRSPGNDRIIGQLVGCGTSVGANYCEADEAVSKKEFINKIGTCKKEAKESKFFLRMAATAEPSLKDEARLLWREAKELHLIFSKIFRSSRGGGEWRMLNDAMTNDQVISSLPTRSSGVGHWELSIHWSLSIGHWAFACGAWSFLPAD